MKMSLMAVLLLAAPLIAAAPAPSEAPQPTSPSPGEIVAVASVQEWTPIDPDDLLIMTLAPDTVGRERKVVIQLIPRPFSTAWTSNIRTLARAHWWDGLAIVRAQDNYVVQWGDPDGEDAGKARALPGGLLPTSEKEYVDRAQAGSKHGSRQPGTPVLADLYAPRATFEDGFPVGRDGRDRWPVHCYATVGVGRGLSPDAGTGAELYAVIGHAPRHLDRNIAVVGRVIEGIEHLSTLTRGTEELGFYATPAERTAISAFRLASELPEAERPRFEYLSTDSGSFAKYANARANRRDAFFIAPAGGVDVCNVPVPVRRSKAAG
jgi:cyclophilin family peptidyl-prolyl cis-trans isomerase